MVNDYTLRYTMSIQSMITPTRLCGHDVSVVRHMLFANNFLKKTNFAEPFKPYRGDQVEFFFQKGG